MKKKVISIIFGMLLLVGGLEIKAEMPIACQVQYTACVLAAKIGLENGSIDETTYDIFVNACFSGYADCMSRQI